MLLAPYKTRVVLMFLALVAGTAASLAPAPLAKAAIDSGILKGDLHTLDLVVVAFVASALVVWAATYAQTYLVGWVGQRALADLRLQIFRHLQEQPVGFYERRPAGMLISRMTNDVEALDSLVTDTVVTLFQASLTLLGSVVILLYLDVQLALLTFLIFPVMAVGSLAFRIASADAYRRTRETISAITVYLQETLSGIRVVRSFAQEPRHRAQFAELNDTNRAANLVTVNLNAAYFPIVEFIAAVATVGILIVGGRQAINGDIEVGVLVGFIAALNGFFDPIGQLSQVYTTYQSGMAALDKIFELLDVAPELTDRPDAHRLERIRGEISFEDVSFRYRTDEGVKLALEDVTLLVHPGETVALVGATGAGKSTFAKLVARFYDPTDGRVLVDGHDLRDVSAHSLRSQMGIVPQEAFLFSGTIADNIAFGRPDADDARDRGRRARGRRVGLRRGAARGAATPRSASAACSSRPASASCSPSPARWSPTRASWSSTRRRRTSTCTPRARSRRACGGCSPGAPRSSSPTACRPSASRGGSSSSTTGRIVEQGTHDELIAAGGAYAALYADWAAQAAA